jgi:hypothetical protein
MSRKCGNCKKWLAAGQYTCKYCGRGEADTLNDAKAAAIQGLRDGFASATAVDENALLLHFAVLKDVQLPPELCGLCVLYSHGCGLESVLKVLISRKCNTISDEHLECYLSMVSSRQSQAKELELQLCAKQERLRDKLRKGTGSLTGLEGQKLAKLRQSIQECRDSRILQLVNDQCVLPSDEKRIRVAVSW